MLFKDLFVKRFLVICLGLSMVIMSVAFLLRSVSPAQASTTTPVEPAKAQYGSGVEIYPLGINNGTAYWLEFNQVWYFNSKSLADWK